MTLTDVKYVPRGGAGINAAQRARVARIAASRAAPAESSPAPVTSSERRFLVLPTIVAAALVVSFLVTIRTNSSGAALGDPIGNGGVPTIFSRGGIITTTIDDGSLGVPTTVGTTVTSPTTLLVLASTVDPTVSTAPASTEPPSTVIDPGRTTTATTRPRSTVVTVPVTTPPTTPDTSPDTTAPPVTTPVTMPPVDTTQPPVTTPPTDPPTTPPTTIPAKATRKFEAAAGRLTGEFHASNEASASAGAFVAGSSSAGDSISWTVPGGARTGSFSFRTTAPFSNANEPYTVLVDGVSIGAISVKPTTIPSGGWTNWANATTESISVPAQYLGVGDHTVTLRRASGGGSGVGVDYLSATT